MFPDITSKTHRYGFNGKELDTEGMGGGLSTYDYGFRIYNPAIGRFLSVDPLTSSYPWNSPYAFAENRVIDGVDLEGLEYYDADATQLSGIYRYGYVPYKEKFIINERAVKMGVYTLFSITTGNASYWLARRYYDNGMYKDDWIFSTDQFHELTQNQEKYKNLESLVEFYEDQAGEERTTLGGWTKAWSAGNIMAGMSLLAKAALVRRSSAIPQPSKNIEPVINPAHMPVGSLKGKSVKHTFTKHGSHNTKELQMHAKNADKAQGQWIDDVAAEEFIAAKLPELKNGTKVFELPKGIGRVVNPDGSFTPATHAVLVPSGSGVLTAYPTIVE